jgi:hypothetical protein
VIEGDLGSGRRRRQVSTSYVVNASYRQEVSLDELGRLRLRILKLRTSDFDPRRGRHGQAATPLARQPDAWSRPSSASMNQWLKTSPDQEARPMLSSSCGNSGTVRPRTGWAARRFEDLDGWVQQQIEAWDRFAARPTPPAARGLRTLVGLRTRSTKALGTWNEQAGASWRSTPAARKRLWWIVPSPLPNRGCSPTPGAGRRLFLDAPSDPPRGNPPGVLTSGRGGHHRTASALLRPQEWTRAWNWPGWKSPATATVACWSTMWGLAPRREPQLVPEHMAWQIGLS